MAKKVSREATRKFALRQQQVFTRERGSDKHRKAATTGSGYEVTSVLMLHAIII